MVIIKTDRVKPSSDGERKATGQEIRAILGPVDDDLVQDILRTGASAKDVMEAREWREEDDYIGARLHKKMSPQCRQIYQFLAEADEAETDQRLH